MKKGLRIFLWILILSIVIFLISKINLREIYHILEKANPFFFWLAVLAYALSFVVFNLRTKYSLSEIVKTHHWFMMKATLAGFFVNTITPGAQLGGDPIRAHFIGKKYQKSKTKLFGAILADRFFHAFASIFFIVISIIFILTFIPISLELKILFEAILFCIFGFFVAFFYMTFRKKSFNLGRLIKKLKSFFGIKETKKRKNNLGLVFVQHFGNFTKLFSRTLSNKKIAFVGISLSLLYWILNFFVSYFLFLSLGINVGFLIVIVAISLANLAGDISPSPGGLGLMEGVMIFVYSLLGITFSIAITVSLISRLIFYFFVLGPGGISLWNLENSS